MYSGVPHAQSVDRRCHLTDTHARWSWSRCQEDITDRNGLLFSKYFGSSSILGQKHMAQDNIPCCERKVRCLNLICKCYICIRTRNFGDCRPALHPLWDSLPLLLACSSSLVNRFCPISSHLPSGTTPSFTLDVCGGRGTSFAWLPTPSLRKVDGFSLAKSGWTLRLDWRFENDEFPLGVALVSMKRWPLCSCRTCNTHHCRNRITNKILHIISHFIGCSSTMLVDECLPSCHRSPTNLWILYSNPTKLHQCVQRSNYAPPCDVP